MSWLTGTIGMIRLQLPILSHLYPSCFCQTGQLGWPQHLVRTKNEALHPEMRRCKPRVEEGMRRNGGLLHHHWYFSICHLFFHTVFIATMTLNHRVCIKCVCSVFPLHSLKPTWYGTVCNLADIYEQYTVSHVCFYALITYSVIHYNLRRLIFTGEC